MNKTVCLTAFVLFFVGVSLNAMEQATTTAAPATGTVAKICRMCPIKSAIGKAFSWCKAHPVYVAAGVSAAAIVAVCLTCPLIKTKVRECLGLEAQKDNVKVDPCFICVEDKADFEQAKSCNEELEMDPLREL